MHVGGYLTTSVLVHGSALVGGVFFLWRNLSQLIPTTEKEASYFYKRKFSIVNGMHTVLGFMTLREKAPGVSRAELRLSGFVSEPVFRAILSWFGGGGGVIFGCWRCCV